MPCYNCEKYVGAAIESVLQQTFADFELIVVNDGSTDCSLQVIESFHDPRVIVVNNDGNQGLVATRNIALTRSSGEYIAILDSDDICNTDRLARQVAFLDEHPDFGMIGAWLEVIDENGVTTGEIRKTPESSELIPLLSLFQNCFAQSSVMLRRAALPNDLYRPEIPFSEDFDLWLRVLEGSKGTNISATLVKYRVHSNNISKNDELMLSGLRSIVKYQLERLGIQPTEEEIFLHLNFFGIGGFRRVSLFKLEKWLNKLIQYNVNSDIYENKPFRNLIWDVWSVELNRQPLIHVLLHGLNPNIGIYEIPGYSMVGKLLLVLKMIKGRAMNFACSFNLTRCYK